MINIAVLGFGVVGSGVVEVLEKNLDAISRKAGEEIYVKYILDKRDFPGSAYEGRFVKDYNIILEDSDISVVVEVMGGVEPAFSFIKSALNAGKSAVSSNKELVAAKGAELLAVAAANDMNFLFEASVGGGIPIIRPIHQCLAANEIDEIAGILNGTTNFILTKMIREGMGFDDALKLAQELGYAEANPSADVDGHDSCRKICILASLAFGSHVYPKDVATQGITAITAQDVAYAQDAGYVIKLIGRARKMADGKIFAAVSPALISRESQLSGVDDVFNAILVRGNATGDVLFYGKGAGKLPTASAVVGDVIDCIKAGGTIQSLQWSDSDGSNLADSGVQSDHMYIRLSGNGAKAAAQQQFPAAKLLGHTPEDEAAIITPEISPAELAQKLDALRSGGVNILACIPVLDY